MNCQHHWVIGTPHGATSSGTCKKCGEERDFLNWIPEHDLPFADRFLKGRENAQAKLRR